MSDREEGPWPDDEDQIEFLLANRGWDGNRSPDEDMLLDGVALLPLEEVQEQHMKDRLRDSGGNAPIGAGKPKALWDEALKAPRVPLSFKQFRIEPSAYMGDAPNGWAEFSNDGGAILTVEDTRLALLVRVTIVDAFARIETPDHQPGEPRWALMGLCDDKPVFVLMAKHV